MPIEDMNPCWRATLRDLVHLPHICTMADTTLVWYEDGCYYRTNIIHLKPLIRVYRLHLHNTRRMHTLHYYMRMIKLCSQHIHMTRTRESRRFEGHIYDGPRPLGFRQQVTNPALFPSFSCHARLWEATSSSLGSRIDMVSASLGVHSALVAGRLFLTDAHCNHRADAFPSCPSCPPSVRVPTNPASRRSACRNRLQ